MKQKSDKGVPIDILLWERRSRRKGRGIYWFTYSHVLLSSSDL